MSPPSKEGTEGRSPVLAGSKDPQHSIFSDLPLKDTKGDDSVPNLEHIANLVKQGKAKNIIVMAGAGISTSAGIPDFRSPETGLYSNLEKYALPYPEAIFDIGYFQKKPQAFYTLAKELYPGNFKPTLTHYFFRLLQDKGILRAVFTQNIDTLERIAGLTDENVIEAHGSFESAECLKCKKQYTKEDIRPQIDLGEVVYCTRSSCKGRKNALVKPKIVFFGEGLPARFFERLSDFHVCDLLVVLGTSLTVQPFASLIDRVPWHCPRVLINLESVGEAEPPSRYGYGEDSEGFDFEGTTGRKGGIRDVRYLGASDEGVKVLCQYLGWEEELMKLYETGRKNISAENEDLKKPELLSGTASLTESKKVNAKEGVAEGIGSGKPDSLEIAEVKREVITRALVEAVVDNEEKPSTSSAHIEIAPQQSAKDESSIDELSKGVADVNLKGQNKDDSSVAKKSAL